MTTVSQHVQHIHVLATAAATIAEKAVPAKAVHARAQEQHAGHRAMVLTVPIFASVIFVATVAAHSQPAMLHSPQPKTHRYRIWKNAGTFNTVMNAPTGV